MLLDRGMARISGDDVLDCLSGRDLDVKVAMLTAIPLEIDMIDLDVDT